VGHPQPDGSRTELRKAWEVLHKGCGYTVLLLGAVNVIYGPIYAHKLRLPLWMVVSAGVFVALSLSTSVITAAALQLRRLQTWNKTSSDATPAEQKA